MTYLLFAGLKVFTFVIWLVALWLGLKWVKAPETAWWRILLIGVFILGGTQLLISFFLPVMVASGAPPLFIWAMIGAFALFGTLLLVGKQFRLSRKETVLASLPTFAAPLLVLLLITQFAKPNFAEAYKIPSGAMSPTLLGDHIRAECPECGAPRYATAPRGPMRPDFFEELEMICDNFHITRGCPPTDESFPGDRILVSKLKAPQRWDLLVFRAPPQPEVIYVMRLVGLPGETIHIENGALYADGEKLPLPPELEGITYADHLEGLGGLTLWGSAEEPATLAEEEYFVLGDFTTNAADSRLWPSPKRTGVSPYAVPKENIIGVVSEIYWPYDRARSF